MAKNLTLVGISLEKDCGQYGEVLKAEYRYPEGSIIILSSVLAHDLADQGSSDVAKLAEKHGVSQEAILEKLRAGETL